jgi:hypothetical protein
MMVAARPARNRRRGTSNDPVDTAQSAYGAMATILASMWHSSHVRLRISSYGQRVECDEENFDDQYRHFRVALPTAGCRSVAGRSPQLQCGPSDAAQPRGRMDRRVE